MLFKEQNIVICTLGVLEQFVCSNSSKLKTWSSADKIPEVFHMRKTYHSSTIHHCIANCSIPSRAHQRPFSSVRTAAEPEYFAANSRQASRSSQISPISTTMISNFITNVSAKFNPFARSQRMPRIFLSMLPPDARTSIKITVAQLPRESVEKGSLSLTFSTCYGPTRAERMTLANKEQRTAKK
jgi:hypothetical protein